MQIWERIVWSKWLILSLTCLFALAGLFYNFVTQPIYSADTTLQIENLKESATGAELGEELTIQGAESPFVAELQIIRSRSVLGSVIDQFQLDIEAKPRYFPFIGEAIARWRASGSTNPLNGYASEAEDIVINMLEVPAKYLDKPLVLTVVSNSQYELSDSNNNSILLGNIGEVSSTDGSITSPFSIAVQAIRGEPGKQFVVTKKSRIEVTKDLRDNLRISELGKESGIVKLELLGPNPSETVRVLDAIVQRYTDKKNEEKIAVVQKNLQFLEERLPAVKADLERYEGELNQFRLDRGSIDFNLEIEGTLSRIVTIEEEIRELNLQRQQLRSRFTAQHPNVTSIDSQIRAITQERNELQAAVNTLPNTQQRFVTLTRNVDVNSKLYTSLLVRAQELNIALASAVSDVNVLDTATVSIEPVKPRKPVSLLIATLLGLFAGVFLSLVKESFAKGVEDPDELETVLGVPVLVTIPKSAGQLSLEKDVIADNFVKSLAHMYPSDLSVEGIRNLRSTVLFQNDPDSNNVILITSASPEVGKSFISLNLAVVLANSGKKVLLLDADMRRGKLHNSFYMEQSPGLADAVAEGSLWLDDVITKTGVDGLSFVPRGVPPKNPSELLFSKKFLAFLDCLSIRFDHVIVDAPPVLAAADAGIIGNS
ncbi:MAG: AAA family ATPase, partial [Acidiferrobacterales bacterium]|nr:AAA family ATPase [Acidiferrobacterales bacterium]